MRIQHILIFSECRGSKILLHPASEEQNENIPQFLLVSTGGSVTSIFELKNLATPPRPPKADSGLRLLPYHAQAR